MRATAWAAEQLAHLVGEPAGDRQPDQVLVVRLDRRAQILGVRLEVGDGIDDHELGERDRERQLHVVDDQRLGVVGDVEARWLLVADAALDEQPVGCEAIGAHAVLAIVEDRQGALWRGRQDRVGAERRHAVDVGRIGRPARQRERATSSISTWAPRGRAATPIVVRAG